ncbi:LysR family transcriptional regulator [Ferrovibrio sp.]|uniref:LysR family transcriptional regulator n=1 Tax=Ferrovibrio sp. TaxID=1917215 RepID=UPI0026061EEE|nr:LysR family transcriptional regulator [Ferrovibrio sp.]
MTNVNLNRLAVFAAVIETGAFTAAARQLGLTKAMVSQHVARLEAELGTTLLIRTTRKVTPTEMGQAFHADCRRILAETEAALARLRVSRDAVVGRLRITCGAEYAAAVLAPALADFTLQHAGLTIDLIASDQVVDLVGERFDLAIRAGWLRDSRLRATRLAGFRQLVVAAPDYLRRNGMPRRPADLATHRWVAMPQLPASHTLRFQPRPGSGQGRGRAQSARVNAVLQTNSTAMMRAFVLEGGGMAVFPDHMVRDDLAAGRLVEVLGGYALPEGGVYAVYPAMRHVPPKTRLFIDFLKQRLAAD